MIIFVLKFHSLEGNYFSCQPNNAQIVIALHLGEIDVSEKTAKMSLKLEKIFLKYSVSYFAFTIRDSISFGFKAIAGKLSFLLIFEQINCV